MNIDAEKSVKHHFVAIPYLHMGDVREINLGFAKIWNFELMKDTYLPEKGLQKQVESMLNSYRTSRPYAYDDDTYRPVHGVGIVWVDGPTDQEPSLKVQLDKNDARLILFVSCIARKNTITRNANTGHSMSSSENYAPVHFSVVVGHTEMTEVLGFVVPSWHGGININKNIYLRGRHVPTPQFEYDADLLSALVELRQKRPGSFRRVISAAEVFFESYYNSTEVSHKARILLQASAFEILLNTKSGKGRKEMKKFINEFADYPEDARVVYKSKRDNKIFTVHGTMCEKWADSFFTLRNDIIHGDMPKEKDYLFGPWQRHFDIAHYFFIFTIKRKVERTLRRNIFNDDVVWKTWTDNLQVTPIKITGFEYNRYGRRGWERIIKRINRKKK